MPLNGGGTASRVPGTTAIPNQTIASSGYNASMDDIYAIFNTPRPIAYGGTNGSSAVEGIDNLSTKGTDIASAATTDIGAATGRFVHITGTTTITSLGTKTAGVVRFVVFDGALTLTHNATSLILPGGVSITTAAGDAAIFVSEGAGNWRCVNYERATTTANLVPYVSGLTLSNNSGTPNTHIDIAAGVSQTSSLRVANLSTLTKRLNATWAAGNNNGGLDTGASAINTTYHVFSIRKQSDGSFDAVFSLSATSPTMTLLTGYDVIQRLGAVRTNPSGNIIAFQQTGNIFRILETVDFTVNATVAQALMTLSVPTGIRVLAMLRFQGTNSGGTSDVGIVTAPGDSSALTTTQLYTSNATGGVSGVKVSTGVEITSQSAQIYRSATVSGGGGQAALINSYGWQEITIPRVG